MKDPLRRVLAKKGDRLLSIAPQDTVFHALQELALHNVGALLVLEGGKPVGMFSERDYARKLLLLGRDALHTRVEEVMSRPVVTIDAGLTVERAMAVMSERHVRHLPVVDGGALAGMVSIGDLVNWIISAQAERIDALHEYIAGGYPG